MILKFSKNLSLEQKFTLFDIGKIDELMFENKITEQEYIEGKFFGYNPTIITIQEKEYKTIPMYKLCRMKNDSDGYYRFIYIQINMENGEYYIGKVNRKRWKDIENYQGSGVLFTSKYNKHKDEFVRYYIASCNSKRECELLEHDIVNIELLKDDKCLNLTVGGGGTSDHCDEAKREKQRAFMKAHPEAFQSMIKEAKRLYTDKDSFALKQRNRSIKETMNKDEYKVMTRERIANWKKNDPEGYRIAREKNKAVMQTEATRNNKRIAREKWVSEHPKEYEEIKRKSAEGNKSQESRKKHSNALKEWAKANPEQAKVNLKKRSEASVKACSKKVAMVDLETNEVLKIFPSQHEAARWLVDNGHAKNINCVSSINAVCQKKPCTTGYGYHKKAYGFNWEYID